MTKRGRGSRKIEFYTNIELIKKRYTDGIVIAKVLFDELIAAKKITMSYQQFSIYFRKTFGDSYTPRTKTIPTVASEAAEAETEHEPIRLQVGGKKGFSFSPHTREIDPKDIL